MLQRLLTMVVVLVVYGGFEWLGFPLATALLTAIIGLLFGATLPAAGIAGVAMGVSLWYAFDTLLDVTLPSASGLINGGFMDTDLSRRASPSP